MISTSSLDNIINNFRAKPQEWSLDFFGHLFTVKNSHGRKIDGFNFQFSVALFLLLIVAVLLKSMIIVYFAIGILIAVLIFNAVTLVILPSIHEQEETTLLYTLANKLPELSEPEGVSLGEVIEEADLVQPVTKTKTMSSKARIAKPNKKK